MSADFHEYVRAPEVRGSTVASRAVELLSATGERWRTLPAPDGLVVLRRLSADEPTSNGHASLCGHIARQGEIADILNLISTSRWTGIFDVFAGGAHKRVFFETGDVRAAASDSPEDRLGEILVQDGLVPRDVLETALADVTVGVPLGVVLVREGLITRHAVYSAILKQVEQIFFSLLLVSEGDFVFVRDDLPEGLPRRAELSTQNLLLEGLQRIDEMSYFREKIPSPEVVLEVVEASEGVEDLPSAERRLLFAIDGSSGLSHAAAKACLSEFDSTKAAFRLLQSGHVKLAARLDVAGRAGRLRGPSGVVSIFNEVLARIVTVAAEQGRGEELTSAISSYLTATEHSKLFRNASLSRAGTFDVELLTRNALAADVPDAQDFAYQGLNELLFFTMFVAGDTLDGDAVEELQRGLEKALGRDSRAP